MAKSAAIIVIVALGLTGRTFVMAQIEGVGSHLVWAGYEGTVTSGVSRTLEDRITEGDVRAIEARRDIFSAVMPIVELRGTVSALSTTSITVAGLTCAIPADKSADVNAKLKTGDTAQIRCSLVSGTNTLTSIDKKR